MPPRERPVETGDRACRDPHPVALDMTHGGRRVKLSWTALIGLAVMLGTVAGVVVLSFALGRDVPDRSASRLVGGLVFVVALAAVAPIVNATIRRGHLLRRAQVLEANGEIVWLADVDIDAHTARVLSGRDGGTTLPRSFVLTVGATGLQFWVHSQHPEFIITWDAVVAVEVAPRSRSVAPGPDLIIHVEGHPILLDVVGPFWGTLPCSRKRVADIAAEITTRQPVE